MQRYAPLSLSLYHPQYYCTNIAFHHQGLLLLHPMIPTIIPLIYLLLFLTSFLATTTLTTSQPPQFSPKWLLRLLSSFLGWYYSYHSLIPLKQSTLTSSLSFSPSWNSLSPGNPWLSGMSQLKESLTATSVELVVMIKVTLSWLMSLLGDFLVTSQQMYALTCQSCVCSVSATTESLATFLTASSTARS